MRKNLIIALIMILTFNIIYWQTFDETEKGGAKITTHSQIAVEMEWQRTFGGADADYAYSLIQTSDGGFALAGDTRSYGAGGTDMWLVKTNAMGRTEWNSTFGGIYGDTTSSLVQTSDGGFALAGFNSSYGTGGDDMLLVKMDANGQHKWNATFGGMENDHAWSLLQTFDGGFALAGDFNYSYGLGEGDLWLVKTDANGQHEWNTTFGGKHGDCAFSFLQTSDGDFVLTGSTSSYGAGEYDMWLVKTNATGHAKWNSTFGGTENDFADSVIQTTDGGFALAGKTRSYGAGEYDMWLVKTNATGHAKWNSTFGGIGDDVAHSLIQTSDGGFALAGKTRSYGADNFDVWLVKTNATGHAEWNITFGGIYGDWAYSMLQTSNGDFVLTGSTSSYGAGLYDMWLVKTVSIANSTSPKSSPALTSMIVILSLLVIVVIKRKNRF